MSEQPESPWRARFERERRARKEAEALLDGKSRELYELNQTLAQRADELAHSLEKLETAQDALIQREKLAALGGLVAGIAHEINTPLGVAVTALTHGIDKLREMQHLVEHGKPTKNLLRTAIAELTEALILAEENLERGGSLVRNFKMVAVDQVSAEMRDVDLIELIEGVIASMRPVLRASRVEVAVVGPHPLSVSMAVGPFTQVLTNLVQNACLHAFDEIPTADSRRRIQIDVEDHLTHLRIKVTDNGRGMSPEVRARVFDPFFTTRRGRGGTGLGMHIVHNIIVSGFSGLIDCVSDPGLGTTWTLDLPVDTAVLRRA